MQSTNLKLQVVPASVFTEPGTILDVGRDLTSLKPSLYFVRVGGSKAEPWTNCRVQQDGLCFLFLCPFISLAVPLSTSQAFSPWVLSTYQNKKRVAIIYSWLNGKLGSGVAGLGPSIQE